MNDPTPLPPEELKTNNPTEFAYGEDEKARPQPADEPPFSLESEDLIDMLKRTVERLPSDGTTRGDLKILSRTLRKLRYSSLLRTGALLLREPEPSAELPVRFIVP